MRNTMEQEIADYFEANVNTTDVSKRDDEWHKGFLSTCQTISGVIKDKLKEEGKEIPEGLNIKVD